MANNNKIEDDVIDYLNAQDHVDWLVEDETYNDIYSTTKGGVTESLDRHQQITKSTPIQRSQEVEQMARGVIASDDELRNYVKMAKSTKTGSTDTNMMSIEGETVDRRISKLTDYFSGVSGQELTLEGITKDGQEYSFVLFSDREGNYTINDSPMDKNDFDRIVNNAINFSAKVNLAAKDEKDLYGNALSAEQYLALEKERKAEQNPTVTVGQPTFYQK